MNAHLSGAVLVLVGLTACTTEHVQRADCYMHQWAVIEASEEFGEDEARNPDQADWRWEAEREACASEDYLLELMANPPWWISSQPAAPEGTLKTCRKGVGDGEIGVYGELTIRNAWASDITIEEVTLTVNDIRDWEVVPVNGEIPLVLEPREEHVIQIRRTEIGNPIDTPEGSMEFSLRHSLLNTVQRIPYSLAEDDDCGFN